jgi:putative sterol carrier protein
MAEQIDPKTFFEVGVPAALEANKELAKQATGKTLQFDIVGKGGGKWTVDLSKATSKAGGTDKADLEVEINVQDFSDLMTGKLAGDTAAGSGRMRAKGNVALLRIFGTMLTGAKK